MYYLTQKAMVKVLSLITNGYVLKIKGIGCSQMLGSLAH